jgi:hypothetical protein
MHVAACCGTVLYITLWFTNPASAFMNEALQSGNHNSIKLLLTAVFLLDGNLFRPAML